VPTELPPFLARLGLNQRVVSSAWQLPEGYAYPYADTSFCPTRRDAGPPCSWAKLIKDEGSVQLDSWCVGSPSRTAPTAVSAGELTLSDAKGHKRGIPGPIAHCEGSTCSSEYPLVAFYPFDNMDLESALTLGAAGDELPAFSLTVPAGAWPRGSVEIGAKASASAGLSVKWNNPEAGENLFVSLGDPTMKAEVYCVFEAATPLAGISPAVIQWLSQRGLTKVPTGATIQRYGSATQGTAEVVVRRSLEFPPWYPTIAP